MLADVAGIGSVNVPAWLIIHHTGGSDTKPLADTSHHTFDMVNNDHKARGFPKSSLGFHIGYHYFIDKNGGITQGRLEKDIGAHTIGYNDKSIGICLAGNFDATLPTEAQINALRAILKAKMESYGFGRDKIVPHRKFASKTCYGNKLPDSWAADLVEPSPLEMFVALQNAQLELFKSLLK